jgi:hypothetical protein
MCHVPCGNGNEWGAGIWDLGVGVGVDLSRGGGLIREINKRLWLCFLARSLLTLSAGRCATSLLLLLLPTCCFLLTDLDLPRESLPRGQLCQKKQGGASCKLP